MDEYVATTPLRGRSGKLKTVGLKVCVNAGNGAGGFFATQVLAPLGADVSSSINLEPDGAFPNHPANPEDKHVQATIDAVAASGADVGVMLDCDVDLRSHCGTKRSRNRSTLATD